MNRLLGGPYGKGKFVRGPRDPDHDEHAVFKGLLICLPISVVIWCAIIFLVRLAL
jgi:hypothetical protein